MQIRTVFRQKFNFELPQVADTCVRTPASLSMSAQSRLARSARDARNLRREGVHGVAHFRSVIWDADPTRSRVRWAVRRGVWEDLPERTNLAQKKEKWWNAIVVTGGAGFVGSCVVRRLVAAGRFAVTLDALTYAGNVESLGKANEAENHRLEVADIRDGEAVRRIFSQTRPDAVIHLAAESHVDRSIDRPMDFVTANVQGTVTLLEASTDYWRGLKSPEKESFRFLHVSTDEVYGSLGSSGVFSESTPYRPNSPYAASKAASDHFARAWHRTFGLPVIISHSSNNYGPYQMPEKLIPVAILAALEGRPVPVYGDGMNVRDWLFVEDHACALETIVGEGVPGRIYNVGSDSGTTNIDMVRAVCTWVDELVPNSPFRPHADLIAFVADRPGHDRRYALDSGRVRRELGWRPSLGLQEGLERTVRWYLENRWWWQGILDGGFDGRRRQGVHVG